MLKIEIDVNKLQPLLDNHYNALYNKTSKGNEFSIFKRLNLLLNKYKTKNNNIEKKYYELLDYLNCYILQILTGTPDILQSHIECIDLIGIDFTDQSNQSFKDEINFIFNYKYFCNSDKYGAYSFLNSLLQASSLEVCPYCNIERLHLVEKGDFFYITNKILSELSNIVGLQANDIFKINNFLTQKRTLNEFDTFIKGLNINDTDIENEITKLLHDPDIIESRAELDHFFSKSKYPYLAISFFNLIPSCHSCNHIKNNIEFSLESNINPFHDCFHSYSKFDVGLSNIRMDEIIKGRRGNFNISFLSKNNNPNFLKSKSNYIQLGIKGKYENDSFKDKVSEILRKANSITANDIKTKLKSYPDFYKDEYEFLDSEFEISFDSKDINKKVLSKFKLDLISDTQLGQYIK